MKRKSFKRLPNGGHQQINDGGKHHSMPNQGNGTVRNEFAEDGCKPPKEHGNMQCDKCFGSRRSFGSHNLFKKSRPLIKAARMLVYKSA